VKKIGRKRKKKLRKNKYSGFPGGDDL